MEKMVPVYEYKDPVFPMPPNLAILRIQDNIIHKYLKDKIRIDKDTYEKTFKKAVRPDMLEKAYDTLPGYLVHALIIHHPDPNPSAELIKEMLQDPQYDRIQGDISDDIINKVLAEHKDRNTDEQIKLKVKEHFMETGQLPNDQWLEKLAKGMSVEPEKTKKVMRDLQQFLEESKQDGYKVRLSKNALATECKRFNTLLGEVVHNLHNLTEENRNKFYTDTEYRNQVMAEIQDARKHVVLLQDYLRDVESMDKQVYKCMNASILHGNEVTKSDYGSRILPVELARKISSSFDRPLEEQAFLESEKVRILEALRKYEADDMDIVYQPYKKFRSLGNYVTGGRYFADNSKENPVNDTSSVDASGAKTSQQSSDVDTSPV